MLAKRRSLCYNSYYFDYLGAMKMKHIKVLIKNTIKDTIKDTNCKECANSCQSACKTSCTVANIVCEK